MKINLNKFKKIHSDHEMSVLADDNGMEVKVSHKHISPKLRGEIEALKLWDGGSVDEKEKYLKKTALEQGQESINKAFKFNGNKEEQKYIEDPYENKDPYVEQKKKQMSSGSYANGGDVSFYPNGGEVVPQDQSQFIMPVSNIMIPPDLQQAQPMDQMPQVAPIPQQQPVAPTQPKEQAVPQDPYGVAEYGKRYTGGYQQQQQGIQQEAQAQQQQAQQEIPAIQRQAEQVQNLQNMYQAHYNKLSQEREALMKDVNDKHIDPDKFWNDKSTMGKVGSAIGLILGGIGSGLTGGDNMALKMLNSQIDRNINAQRADVENKFNLLNANKAQFANEYDAVQMTKAMLGDQLSSQLKLAAAKATDPAAKARALKAAGDLEMQSAPVMSQIALRQTMLGGSPNVSPVMKIQYSPMLDPNQKAEAMKQYGEYSEANKAFNNIMTNFDKINSLATVKNSVTGLGQTGKKIDALLNPTLAELSKAFAGKFTEFEANALRDAFPKATDSNETIKVKRQNLAKLLQQKMNYPLLETVGVINQQAPVQRFNQQGQSQFPMMKPVKMSYPMKTGK